MLFNTVDTTFISFLNSIIFSQQILADMRLMERKNIQESINLFLIAKVLTPV